METKQKNSLVSGPIYSSVIRVAWPIMASMLLEFSLLITDFYWIGKLGSEQQDAMTSSMIIVWTVFAMISLVTIGLNAMVARNYGAGDFERAGYVATQGVKLAIVCGLIYGSFGAFFCDSFLRFMDAEPQVISYGVSYLRIFFIATPLLFVADSSAAVFRASGDTRTPLLVSIIGVGLNLILDPVLIFGWGFAPELGMAGAAWGTLISIAVAVILYSMLYSRRLTIPFENFWREKLEKVLSLSILKVGLPISTQQLVFILVYWGLMQVVHRFGYISGAAMGIGNRLESINYLATYALSLAASAIVGQCLGASKPERAEKSAWAANFLGMGFTAFVSFFFLLIPEQLAAQFSDDPQVISITRDYLIILGLSQIFMAVEIVLEGAFSGAGDTAPPMLISIPGSILRIPMAYYLAVELGWGINGVWWTLTITTVLKAAVMALWFGRGKWKLKKVDQA